MLSAFVINLALWAGFMIADEVFLAYPMENVHRSVFAAQLITLGLIGTINFISPELRSGFGAN